MRPKPSEPIVSRDAVSATFELSGAATVVAGVAILAGVGWGLVVAGALSMLFGFLLGVDEQ